MRESETYLSLPEIKKIIIKILIVRTTLSVSLAGASSSVFCFFFFTSDLLENDPLDNRGVFFYCYKR